MITAKEKNIIKNSLNGIDYEKLILFGSRARGDNRKDSDYDLMVVVSKNISIHEKFKIQKILRTYLAENLMDADVIVKSNDEIIKYKNSVGSIVKDARIEGKEI
ncbi:MAG: nucleotidyltransferase domain-containing protein [bacterium]